MIRRVRANTARSGTGCDVAMSLEIADDHYPAVPELRVQLYSDLPDTGIGQRTHRPPRVWPLPLHPLVVTNQHSIVFPHGHPGARVRAGAPRQNPGRGRTRCPAGLGARVSPQVRRPSHPYRRRYCLGPVHRSGGACGGDLPQAGRPRRGSHSVIQAIAIGIGFLGSGVIFVSRADERVLGLTTAASIWATAAVGVAAGLGYYLLSAATTILLLLVLRALPRPGD
jgi:hypothetical protein